MSIVSAKPEAIEGMKTFSPPPFASSHLPCLLWSWTNKPDAQCQAEGRGKRVTSKNPIALHFIEKSRAVKSVSCSLSVSSLTLPSPMTGKNNKSNVWPVEKYP